MKSLHQLQHLCLFGTPSLKISSLDMVVDTSILHTSLATAKIVSESGSAWNGVKPRAWQISQFRRMINHNAVLGYVELLKRKKYATTPIIEAMGRCNDFGSVSVVPVASALGKTTAANYFLRKNKGQVRGLAFCRTEVGIPYVTSMLHLLGLDANDPPQGWLSCLFDVLNERTATDGRTSVLILDEFVSSGQDDADSALLMKIKALVRNSKTCVIVLTPSERYAHYLLTLNNLQGIVPLQGTYPVDEYPCGQWKSMHWSRETMKVAARQLPSLSCQKEISIDEEIDKCYDTLTQEQQKNLTLLKVEKLLREKLFAPLPKLDQLNVERNTSSEVDKYTDHTCTVCCVS